MIEATNVVSLSDRRDAFSPLQSALKAIERHPKLRDLDKAVLKSLSARATETGYFNLDQLERQAVTALEHKFKLMGCLKRAKDAGLLHKIDHYRLFAITENLNAEHTKAAQHLFRIKGGFDNLFFALRDTGTRAYEASWFIPKIERWSFEKLTEGELVDAVRELTRLRYFRIGIVEGNDPTLIRFEPSRYSDFASTWRWKR